MIRDITLQLEITKWTANGRTAEPQNRGVAVLLLIGTKRNRRTAAAFRAAVAVKVPEDYIIESSFNICDYDCGCGGCATWTKKKEV